MSSSTLPPPLSLCDCYVDGSLDVIRYFAFSRKRRQTNGSGHIDVIESIRKEILFTHMSKHNDLTMILENLVIDRREKASSPMDDSERQLVINCLLFAADISNPGTKSSAA